MSYKDTQLWRKTLAPAEGMAASGLRAESVESTRDQLRGALDLMRQRAVHLGEAIARDLPDFTTHDVTHLDALWETAELVAGPDYPLTPAEGFVLGAAFLVHDLGLGLAAWPRLAELKRDARWGDAVVVHYRRSLNRRPTQHEMENPEPEVKKAVIADVLRMRHAEHAKDLMSATWQDPKGGSEYALIEVPELRDNFGELIGRIAHSHWWPVSRLAIEFGRPPLGAPGLWPPAWTVDPLRLAGILRLADASHLDERRAPGFLRALRRPHLGSRDHWIFQERLLRPTLEGHRLVYTAAKSFEKAAADPWWLCLEVLRAVDHELHEMDALLSDLKRRPFRARGVAGVESALRLSEYVRVSGWRPVDARVHASDAVALVDELGGEKLYGDDSTVPLRELLQNAADAVRARRLLQGRADGWGTVTVRSSYSPAEKWIEVEDEGIGMSESTLLGTLLNFGKPYWGSQQMLADHPGLWGKGFEPGGRFGIGFFSVFMWGCRLQVTTRPYRDAQDQTLVLEFSSGLRQRPLMRLAEPHEQRIEPGTRVRVWLDSDGPIRLASLASVVPLLAPALDVNLEVDDAGGKRQVIWASDWQKLAPVDLVKRTQTRTLYEPTPEELKRLRLLEEDGRFIGRAALTKAPCSAVTIAGLRSKRVLHFCGVINADPLSAARRGFEIDSPSIRRWASEQAELIASALPPEQQTHYVQAVLSFHGVSGPLKVVRAQDGHLSYSEIVEWARPRSLVECVHGSPEALGPSTLAYPRRYNRRLIQEAVAEAWAGKLREQYDTASARELVLHRVG